MGWLLNGIDSGGIPMHLVKALLSAGEIKYFVETGTQGGRSVAEMIGRIRELHTIEIDPNPYIKVGGINFHCGNSVNILPKIIETLDGSPCLFWLDAHYSGSVPNDTGYPECPLIEEIRAVAKYKNSLIIIDDLRLFSGFAMSPLDDREWPKIADIFHELRVAFPANYTTVTDDYIVSVPWNEFKDALDKEWRERFNIRYPSSDEVKRLAYKVAYNDAMKNLEYFKTWISI